MFPVSFSLTPGDFTHVFFHPTFLCLSIFSAIHVTQNKIVPTFPLDYSHGQKWPLEEEATASSWWLRKPLWKRCCSELALVESSRAIYR